jgi:tetratricopeptide (TPR) repeat protein
MAAWFKHSRVRDIIHQAFFAAERCEYEEAMQLLRQALKIAPNNGPANNEMGFCLMRTGEPERAMQFARQAVRCEPNNPKFWNSLLGVQFEYIKRLKTKNAVSKAATVMMKDIEHLSVRFPDYPPAYLSKADVLAISGASREEWEAALEKCAEAYEKSKDMASGLPATRSRVVHVMSEQVHVCLALAKHWANLPKA